MFGFLYSALLFRWNAVYPKVQLRFVSVDAMLFVLMNKWTQTNPNWYSDMQLCSPKNRMGIWITPTSFIQSDCPNLIFLTIACLQRNVLMQRIRADVVALRFKWLLEIVKFGSMCSLLCCILSKNRQHLVIVDAKLFWHLTLNGDDRAKTMIWFVHNMHHLQNGQSGNIAKLQILISRRLWLGFELHFGNRLRV